MRVLCCDSNQDLELKKAFQSMNISDPACTTLVKSILCAKCNLFSADLFGIDSGTRTVPVLCTVSEISTSSKTSSNDFCSRVWNACKAEPIINSPFVPSLQGRTELPINSTPSKLTDICQPKSDFCDIFGGSSEDRLVCFNGSSTLLHNTVNPQPPSGICLEQVTNGSYLYMEAHPDGSNRVFLASQIGKIWLGTVPEKGNGEEIVIDESNLFVDLTDIVHMDSELGLMTLAFHPRFVHNGCFFASYICDGDQWSGCSGKCACNTDVNCDPSKFPPVFGSRACRFHVTVSEFTVNSSTSGPPLATRGNPIEVRRIFTMGIAYKNSIASQILFGPDGYLYFLTGDGETELDSYNLAQKKKSVLGKVLRFDVDNFPNNPYIYDKESQPEIWALGLRNPWRCSFDSKRPSYFLCVDSGKDQYEEVDIVMKGGNYGRPYFEGDFPFHSLNSSGGNNDMNSANFVSHVMGYDHSHANTNEGSSSIAGGFFIGPKPIHAYMAKNPENSGNFTSAKVPFNCAHDSLLPYIFLLTSNGVLRIARPSRCNYKCSKEKFTGSQTPRHSPLPETSTGVKEAPFTPEIPLGFCPNDESVCCDSNQDLEWKKAFQSMNISDSSCASVVKSILCAKCNRFSADLFGIDFGTRMVPVLCTVSDKSTLSKTSSNDFCSRVWDACKAEPIINSPFVHSLQGRTIFPVSSTPSKLTDICQSKSDFCKIFGGSSEDRLVCFNGSSTLLHNTENPQPPSGICLEQVTDGPYLYMDAHPDGSNRVFFASQHGKIWLATVPEEGNGEEMVIDESNLFVDLTDAVHSSNELGLMSMAFHPRFVHNGRFFASYICDGEKLSRCFGRCACNTDVNCDPSKLPPVFGSRACRFHVTVSEFTVNSSTSDPPLATRGNPSEVRRIFTIGIAYKNAGASQILFGPDGYLYFLTGDGESELDPYNFAQNKKSMLGKVLRFDIDNFPSAAELSRRNAWGNYSIPRDNPYIYDKESLPEIWALGFRHPWRCSFDSERPSYFLCGDSGKDQYEEVDIVMKGGNYGWPYFEGDFPLHSLNSSGGNNNMNSANFISHVMGYDHSNANTEEGSSLYVFTDLYGFAIWAGTENPDNGGNFTSAKVPFSCAHDSPLQCKLGKTHPHLNLNYVFLMGRDKRKDNFLLTSNGVLRIARSSRCNYKCSEEKFSGSQIPRHSPLSETGTDVKGSQTGSGVKDSQMSVVFLQFNFVLSFAFYPVSGPITLI
ncbi:hypothetical protein MKX01_032319 [Papaver californicum]|nr:hypothetical protein MKX01_032319 [Papaver californicum]